MAYSRDLEFRSKAHAAYRAKPQSVFACPADARVFAPTTTIGSFQTAMTSYLGVSGIDYRQLNGTLYVDSEVRFTDITDGTSTTLLCGERPPSRDQQFGWLYAGRGQYDIGSGDMVLGVNEINVCDFQQDCWRGPYEFSRGSVQNQCDWFHFWSLHRGGGNFLFADGSAKYLPYASAGVLLQLAARSSGDLVVDPG